METQFESSHSKPIAPKQIIKPGTKWRVVAIATLSVILLAAALVMSLSPTDRPVTIQLASEAASARYTALASYYTAKGEANRQRAIEASATRYNGLAEFYLADQQANAMRASQAETARYTAMLEHFMAQREANRQRASKAESARLTGLADLFITRANK